MARATTNWPILSTYEGANLLRVAMPIGGIGAGCVSLGGRGDLRDWEVMNRPAKGFTPSHGFFALWTRTRRGVAARALEGPIDPTQYEGAFGCAVPNHHLPRMRGCRFHAAYPLAQVELADRDVPLRVRLEAFNPLIPGEVDDSGAPVAVLRYVLHNPGRETVRAAVCGNLENFIGNDGVTADAAGNVNRYREDGLRGVFLGSAGVPMTSEVGGTMALTTTATRGVSHRTDWADLSWGDSWLDWWDDFIADGALEPRPPGMKLPRASLCVRVDVPPGASVPVTFILAWHFPNRMGWAAPRPPNPTDRVGNFYATRWADAWDVARWTARELRRLEERTVAFVRALVDSDLPQPVREAALNNLSTLRSQTCFRTEDGRFYGWEGTGDHHGSCHGSCTHVWNYEHATGFLFGALARDMRETEFTRMTRDDGLMRFRVDLPLASVQWRTAAADGQMGALMRLHREWRLSGDDAWLRGLWPRARRALEFAWIPGGWDADQDGVMEGCQHNTMDVEYYGPNPQMGLWYLGALRACADMARHLDEVDFAARCLDLAQRGGRWIDANLFNGEWYEHEIRPIADPALIADGLRHDHMGARDLADPDFQLGAGCLVDQLVGQFTAHICGLGHLVDPKHLRAVNRSLIRYNFRGLHDHFNHLRTFALGDERALLMATYPRGRRTKRPFPYYNEVMTGFEYAAAIEMIYEGQAADGLRCIAAIRERYDGRRRNPFDEAECGHHYARAMASWAAIPALTGFHWDGVTGEMRFAVSKKAARWFWSNGSAWGTIEQRPRTAATLTVLHGEVALRRIVIGATAIDLGGRRLSAGQSLTLAARRPVGGARR
ncbi:MAG TPA: GH116 family glycosyl-hydrolase [Planctomycetota bacterium]|nr:GH116 family glycosyl-hydrolase [Planctomycetota bacterium]